MNSTNIWVPNMLGAHDKKTKISTLNKLIFLPKRKMSSKQEIATHCDGSFHISRTQQDIWLRLHDSEVSFTEERLLGPSLERYRKSNRFRMNLKQGSLLCQKFIMSCKKQHGLKVKIELWKWSRTT